MARTTNTSNKTSTRAVKKTPVVTDNLVDNKEISEGTDTNIKPTFRVRETLPANAIISVRNGFNGKLLYRSRKTGEVYIWEMFGDEQDIEFQELRNARNSYRSFFENNWFLFDDPEVIDCLDLKQYYKNALSYEEFDSVFKQSAEEIKDRLSKLSKGQKSSVAYRAKQLIREGGIDSIKVINAVEDALGIELIER